MTRSCHTASAMKAATGSSEQPGRGSRCQHEPAGQRERSNGAEARVADARVEAGEARMFGCARRPPVAIFV